MHEKKHKIMIEKAKILLGNGKWSAIVQSLDEGIHIVNNNAVTILYNESAARMDGLSPEEVLGNSIFEAFPSLTFESSTLIQVLQSGKELSNSQQTFINIKGEKISTINKTVPITFNDGTQGAMEISRDVTMVNSLVNNINKLRGEINDIDSFQCSVKDSPLEPKIKSNNTRYNFADLIGEEAKFKSALADAVRAAASDSSVLIVGETGTGKELFAQGIHNASSRSNKPFIAQNCAAVPRDLLESLLFGTEEGSFTGASSRPGLFEQARGGTILLDEINSLNLDMQAKLLRVLQEGSVRRVGGQEEKEVNVRVLTTMNQTPEEAFAEGSLRQDLFYRLGVVCLSLPPLRQRREDIPLLIEHFINLYNKKFDYEIQGVTDSLKDKMLRYKWPGNVRELQHIIECGFNLIQKEKRISVENIPLHQRKKLTCNNSMKYQDLATPLLGDELPELSQYLEKVEIRFIKRALNKTEGNISKAGKKLGLSRQLLKYKLNKYKLE